MKKLFCLFILLCVGFSINNVEGKKKEVILLANSIDYANTEKLMGFLHNKAFEVTRIEASQWENYKNSPLIVILGGPDAPEGVGEIVKQLLSIPEQDSVRTGLRKMFLKTNVFTRPQRIYIFCGRGREETRESHEENGNSIESP